MKKTKILTGISALALVLSLGACNTSGENDSPSDSEQASEKLEGLNDYTLSFAFTQDGNLTILPDYESVFIIGSWDSWNEYIELEENDGLYSYTFDFLPFGTYEYKGILWYKGENDSLDDGVEIITNDGENVSFEVYEQLGDNFINSLSVEFVDSLIPLGEIEDQEEALEIALTILEGVPIDTSLDELWDKVNIEMDQGFEHDSYYLEQIVTLEDVEIDWDWGTNTPITEEQEVEHIRGIWVHDDYQYNETKYEYIKNDMYYSVMVWEDGYIDRGMGKFKDQYGDLLEPYNEPVLKASSFSQSIQNGQDENGDIISFSVTRKYQTYSIEIEAESSGTYIYESDWDLNLAGLGYIESEDQSYIVRNTTIEDIENAMNDFRVQWGATDPGETLELISENCNYKAEYKYYEYLSTDTITYSQYINATDEEFEQLYDDLSSSKKVLNYATDVVISYTEDAILLEYYVEQQVGFGLVQVLVAAELLVNGEDGYLYDYASVDEVKWNLNVITNENTGEVLSSGIYKGVWQDYFYSLADACSYGVSDNFTFQHYSETLQVCGYNVLDDLTSYLFFVCSGGDLALGSSYNESLGNFIGHYLTWYYPATQTMDTEFFGDTLVCFDELTLDAEIYYMYVEVYSTITDVWNVDLSSFINGVS